MENSIEIVVGQEPGTTYILRKDLLAQQSDYFDRALKSGFAEAGSGTFNLPDCDNDVMKLLLYWLEEKTLDALLSWSKLKKDNVNDQFSADLFIRSWVFADRYLMSAFKREVLRALLETIRRWDRGACLRNGLIRRMFRLTTDNSVLRLVMVRECLNTVSREHGIELEVSALGDIDGFLVLFIQEYRAAAQAFRTHPAKWSLQGAWTALSTYEPVS